MNIFSEFFSHEFLCYCFSSNWKHKNQKCKQLIEFTQEIIKGKVDLPNDFIHVPNLPKCFVAIWNLNNEFLDNSIPKLNNLQAGLAFAFHLYYAKTASNT